MGDLTSDRDSNAARIEGGLPMRTDIGAKDYPGHGAWAMAYKYTDKWSGYVKYFLSYNRAGASFDNKPYPTIDTLLNAMSTLKPHSEWQPYEYEGSAFEE